MNNTRNIISTFKGAIVAFIYLFCLVVAVELTVNYFSFYYLFPVKNATSYGYIERSTGKTIIPLNKYSKRAYAQLALPYEILASKAKDKPLKKAYNKNLNKFGYVDKDNKVVIGYNFVEAKDFEKEYAIVAINKNNSKKYGTIDKNGNWVIKPKYEYLCPFLKYYTKACLDKKHCGIIDKFGNEITVMSYKIDRLHCEDGACRVKFCAIGSKSKDISCNYFL